jgi:hypothetical protein
MASKAFARSVSAGDLLIVGTFDDLNASVYVSDTLGNTFTQVAVQQVANDHVATVLVATAKSSGYDKITLRVRRGQNIYAFSIHEYSGVTAAVDRLVTAQGYGNSVASGGLTTTNPNDLLFVWFTNGNNSWSEYFNSLNPAYTQREMSGTGTTQCFGVSNCVESADLITNTVLNTNATATLSASDVWSASLIAFKAAAGSYSISGTVSGSPATVTLSGASGGETMTNANGLYTFTGLSNGSYVASPSQPGYSFSPATASVYVSGANVTGVDFTATAAPPAAWLSWTASDSADVSGYNVYRSGTAGGPYTRMNSYLISGTSYVDYNISGGRTYYYVATAVNSSGQESGYSNQSVTTVP